MSSRAACPPHDSGAIGASGSSAPFNRRNRLISAHDIRRMLRAHGVTPPAEEEDMDCAEYYKSMVHRSYCTRKNENFHSGNLQCPANCLPLQEESNERLELLGDAVLNLVVAEYLYDRFPAENEGFLTRLRSKIVNGQMLAELSLALGLDRFVIISRQIEENDGRRNKKILEDCFEAFLGALYLSTGSYADARTWFISFLEANVDITSLVLTQNSSKDLLAKYFQHSFSSQPRFVEDPAAGGHGGGGAAAARYRVMVQSPDSGAIVGTGTGATRKLAEEDAARAALRYFGIANYEYSAASG